MISDGRETLRNPPEQCVAVMENLARLPMHGLNLHHLPAEQISDALMPQANTEHRHVRMQDYVARDAEVPHAIGASRAGRNDRGVEVKTADLLPIHFVVAHDDRHLSRNRRNGMDQVKSERIVVIYYETGHDDENRKSKNQLQPELHLSRRCHRAADQPGGGTDRAIGEHNQVRRSEVGAVLNIEAFRPELEIHPFGNCNSLKRDKSTSARPGPLYTPL